MSNRICGKCGSHRVVDAGSYAGSSFFKCETCGQLGMREKFPRMTVFHQITTSPEVLAVEFVEPYTTWDADGRLNKMWQTSLRDLSGRLFDTREEAIAATVERLKEVEK